MNNTIRPLEASRIRRNVLVGLIGKDIQESRSPTIHVGEADAQGVCCLYQLLDLTEMGRDARALPRLLESAELMGFDGVNVTHPCKQVIIPLLDELSDEAQAIGAVNTVRFVGGKRKGYNTDADGFAASFRRGLCGAPLRNVVQLGAGGAGAATAYALLDLGVEKLRIVDTASGRAAELCERLNRVYVGSRLEVAANAEEALHDAQGLVNATPVGMRQHPGLPVDASSLHAGIWVAEVVYFPLETELLRCARQLGCRTLDGGGMAVFQAAKAFEIFTSLIADRERMLAAFESGMSK